MTAADQYKSGRLQDAIAAQLLDVREHPTDHAKRLFLFELLTFAGDLDRAQRQIDMIEYKDTLLDASTAIYKRLLDSERARRDVLRLGGLSRQRAGVQENRQQCGRRDDWPCSPTATLM